MENIDDIDYRHGNNVFKRFKLKHLGEYHDLYVQSEQTYISEDLSIIEMNKTKVKMNKPIYLGLSILEISKLLMYEF